MKKLFPAIILCFLFIQCLGQQKRKVSTYLHMQYNKTIYDQTIRNNPSGVGLGLQLFFNNKSKFKATIEGTADVYLDDTKILRLDANGNPIRGIGEMFNFMAGASYKLTALTYLSVVAGPSFVGERTRFALKP